MVQNGKLAASALALATTALNKVDFPTLGSPTIPALSILDLDFGFNYKDIAGDR
jgi:hypothetical protein